MWITMVVETPWRSGEKAIAHGIVRISGKGKQALKGGTWKHSNVFLICWESYNDGFL